MTTLVRRSAVAAVPIALLSGGLAGAVPGRPAAAVVRDLPGTSCTAFPADNVWHASIASVPVNAHSAEWVRSIGSDNLHPDFGPSYGAQPVPYGIPITYVGGSHPKVHVHFTYSSESDHVRYPLGSDTKIEGGKESAGDRHAIVVSRKTCRVYETWDTRHSSSGWTAGSGATWSLKSDKLRPSGWTSADAAGLPILPGLLRVDEVKAGYVDHAIRFTAPETSRHFIWPARHEAGSTDSTAYPPMGARFRLKASFPISSYSKPTRVVLQAMKTYGLILADNGSPWYFQGEASTKWPISLISEMKTIPGSAFEAVDESTLEVSSSSARAR
ncbi:MAG TPA: hypothetical protein VHC43_02585 [Mycobacteriales bacterium]|nr:hypothetical protein [Mycobacteriales bacterium]